MKQIEFKLIGSLLFIRNELLYLNQLCCVHEITLGPGTAGLIELKHQYNSVLLHALYMCVGTETEVYSKPQCTSTGMLDTL